MKEEKLLKNTNPSLLEEWDFTKNKNISVDTVSRRSGIKVWWICKRGHSWKSSVSHRTEGKGCPQCKWMVDKSESFGHIFPELAKEWHPTKNTLFTAYDLHPGSTKNVWWVCKLGHEWKSEIRQRVRHATGCPFCFGSKAGKETCLSTINPELAKEWHPTKNGDLTPEDVRFGSTKNVWWKCENGHEWKAVISVRNYSGCRCPECSKLVTLKDGTKLNSMVEAFYYLKFMSENRVFQYDRNYPKSKYRYDFYFPKENLFVEVTSYNKRGNKKWFSYLRKIVKKKRYVENILFGNFEFIQHEIKNRDLKFVKSKIL